jgi:hypothetical protein
LPCDQTTTRRTGSDRDQLFHRGSQDRAASRVRSDGGDGGVCRFARRGAVAPLGLLRRLRRGGPTHRAGAGRGAAGDDLSGGLRARVRHRGEARRGERGRCDRYRAGARRRWWPPSATRMATFSGSFRTERMFAMSKTKATEKGRAQTSTKDAASNRKSSGFSAEERAAMKERAQELKAEARRGRRKADGESDVLAKIAEMPEADRAMATRLHELIKASAPDLSPKTWYGMPAYANATRRSSASSKARRSSRRGTPRSAFKTRRTSTKATCGRPPSRSRS